MALTLPTSQPRKIHRRNRPRVALEDRFWAKVDKKGPPPSHAPHLGPCWLWTASLDGKGYGQINVGIMNDDGYVRSKVERAHRVSYLLLVGEPPPGLHLDHLCRVRSCVNPAHLEPVTNAENQARGLRRNTTHCPRGHPYDEANTRKVVDNRGRIHRSCLTCRDTVWGGKAC